MIFLEAQGVRLSSLARGVWDPRATLPADLPTGINVLRVPRAVNAHDLILPLRPTAPRTKKSFSEDVFLTTLASGQIDNA